MFKTAIRLAILVLFCVQAHGTGIGTRETGCQTDPKEAGLSLVEAEAKERPGWWESTKAGASDRFRLAVGAAVIVAGLGGMIISGQCAYDRNLSSFNQENGSRVFKAAGSFFGGIMLWGAGNGFWSYTTQAAERVGDSTIGLLSHTLETLTNQTEPSPESETQESQQNNNQQHELRMK